MQAPRGGDVDYEAYVARARKRFTGTVAAIVVALIAGLYVPWALAAARMLSPGTAEVVTCVSAFLLIGAWNALLMKIRDSSDAPTRDQRSQHLLRLLLVAGAILGTIVLLGVASCCVGWITLQGVGWSIGFSFLLGMMVGRVLLGRALRDQL